MTEEIKENNIESPKKSEKKPPENPYKKGDYKAFVRFYSMPTPYKTKEFGYDTEGAFAKENNLSPDTLTDWKKRADFNKDVDGQLMKWGADKTPDVIASLFRTILKDGKSSEVKLWLQFIKGWKEGMVLEQTIETRENPLTNILDKLDEPTRNKIIEQLKADRETEERSAV